MEAHKLETRTKFVIILNKLHSSPEFSMEFSNVRVPSITAEAWRSNQFRANETRKSRSASHDYILARNSEERDPASVYRRGGRGQWRRGEYKGSNLCQSRKRGGGSCVFDFPPAGVAPRVSRAGP